MKEKKEDLTLSVSWEDFLVLASKVRQQEEIIKVLFNNLEILRVENLQAEKKLVKLINANLMSKLARKKT
jgi:hypothetical protein